MTAKRFTILYGLDEDPFDWDILDNEKDAIICQYNGTPICELLNELHEENEQLRHDATILIQSNQDYRKENEQLKQDNNALIYLLENQSMIIQELHSKLLEYQIQEPIVLTKEDLELMGKAISYYTHGRYAE